MSYSLCSVAMSGEEAFAITKFPQMWADEMESWAFTKVLKKASEIQGSWMRIWDIMLC